MYNTFSSINANVLGTKHLTVIIIMPITRTTSFQTCHGTPKNSSSRTENKQRLWITKEKVSYSPTDKVELHIVPNQTGDDALPLLLGTNFIFCWIHVCIAVCNNRFKQGKIKLKARAKFAKELYNNILKDCQDAGYYMQLLCSLFVCFLPVK